MLSGTFNAPTAITRAGASVGFMASSTLGIFATTGVLWGAVYMLWLYQRVMFGPVTNPANEKLPDLNFREMVCFVPLIIICFWIGVYPKPFFRMLEAPVKKIVMQVNRNYYNKTVIAQPVLPPPSAAAPAAAAEGK